MPIPARNVRRLMLCKRRLPEGCADSIPSLLQRPGRGLQSTYRMDTIDPRVRRSPRWRCQAIGDAQGDPASEARLAEPGLQSAYAPVRVSMPGVRERVRTAGSRRGRSQLPVVQRHDAGTAPVDVRRQLGWHAAAESGNPRRAAAGGSRARPAGTESLPPRPSRRLTRRAPRRPSEVTARGSYLGPPSLR